ncbi:MAG: ABC transporter substrate-binding protein [Chloroflexi bacterium]|nr:ABC transporter substrate-binding protein [Chloroflexota bacterium]
MFFKRNWLLTMAILMLLLGVITCTGTPAPGQATTAAPAPGAGEIKIGALYDLTGPTSDVGKDYALGIQEAIKCLNEAGGVNGKLIKLAQADYGYRVPEALTTYKRYRDFDKIIALLGWGTGDTAALSPTVANDKIPDISASYSGELSNPAKAPYNFYAATDYSTNARAALTTWYDEVWKKDPRFASEQGRKPRFELFYSFATPYSTAPIKALKEQAELLGFEVGKGQDVSLTALDTKSQVLAAKDFKPDLVWHGNTTGSVATALKDAKALGLGADHIVNNWGFDENLPRLAGEAAEGNVYGIGVTAFYGESVPGMDKVIECAKKYNPSVPQEARLIRTVQAWANVLALAEALKRADKAGSLSGTGVKDAFETFQNVDVGLGVTPLSYTASDHRPGSLVRVYKFQGGKPVLVKTIDMKERFPNEWGKWVGY